ncbi:MAG TPA: hypothetical protein VIL74_03940 [Pyrinomonadaceae bacterium]|jgi:hypothetical protein
MPNELNGLLLNRLAKRAPSRCGDETRAEEYAATPFVDFEPQIAGHCDDCVKLEYKF